MLQLAGLREDETTEYKNQFENNELRQEILASLRVLIQKKKSKAGEEPVKMDDAVTTTDTTSTVVVEAQACKCSDILNESPQAIYGLLAASLFRSTERLAALPVIKRDTSPFYRMLAAGTPVPAMVRLVRASAMDKSIS